MKSKILRLISLLVLMAFAACTVKAPILMYKDESEKNPNQLKNPTRLKYLTIGLIIHNIQAMKGVNIVTPVFPIFSYFKAEFPKKKQGEFLEDMIRQYFLDVGIFECVYNPPFKNEDVDIILHLSLNKFELYNDKLYANLMAYGSIVVPIAAIFFIKNIFIYSTLALVTPITSIFIREIYHVEYDFQVELILPDNERIKGYKAHHKGKEIVGSFKSPYGEYLFYKSVFKRVFLKVMDEISTKILADKEKIIRAYRRFLLK